MNNRREKGKVSRRSYPLPNDRRGRGSGIHHLNRYLSGYFSGPLSESQMTWVDLDLIQCAVPNSDAYWMNEQERKKEGGSCKSSPGVGPASTRGHPSGAPPAATALTPGVWPSPGSQVPRLAQEEPPRKSPGPVSAAPPQTRSLRTLRKPHPGQVWAMGDALRSIIKEHPRGDQEKRRATHRKTDLQEGRVHQGSPWVTQEGWRSDGRRAQAGWGHRYCRPHGQLVGHTPGGSRAGRVRLGLPNSPASGREAEVTTSNHQVRLAALALAQAQACGTETQDRTANCRSGGAGSSSSPAFQLAFNSSRRFSGVGWAGRWEEGPEVGCRNPEGESFPGCCVDIFKLLLFLGPREPSGKDGVRKM